MARWLLACALMIAVPASPLLTAICQTTCAKHATHSGEADHSVSHEGHGGAHHPATMKGAAAPVTRACDRAVWEATDARQPARGPLVKAAVAQVTDAPRVPSRALPAFLDSRRHLPDVSRTISQLRV
jgi:hypothetical protein